VNKQALRSAKISVPAPYRPFLAQPWPPRDSTAWRRGVSAPRKSPSSSEGGMHTVEGDRDTALGPPAGAIRQATVAAGDGSNGMIQALTPSTA